MKYGVLTMKKFNADTVKTKHLKLLVLVLMKYLFVFWQFYAVYAFQARCDQELTLQEYQHVRILQFSDLGGNKDWWLAESNGQKGYVPANYLGRMSYA